MPDNKIKAIIFDLGNVLVDFDHRIAAKKVAALSQKSIEEIFKFFFNSPLTLLFEEGKISPQAFFQQVKKELGLRISYSEFLPIWNRIFFITEKNKQVFKIASRLRKKYKVALLSNINYLHFNYLENNFEVFEPFHNLFLSYELKLIKPHPQIYNSILKTLKVRPQEAFYTDDRRDLILEARKLGIKAYVFKGISKLKRDLRNCRVVVNENE